MRLVKDWRTLINVDFPNLKEITEKTRLYTIKNAHRFRGSVRVSLGKFSSDSKYKIFRDKILKKPLP